MTSTMSSSKLPGSSSGLPAPVTKGSPSRAERIAALTARRLVDVLIIVVGYLAYAKVRGIHGEDESPEAYARALSHGYQVADLQAWLRLPTEVDFQRPLLEHETFLIWVGGYYGAAHFIVTIGTLLWLMVRRPAAYAWWRNALGALTAAAVGLFALYPTAPPRLLPEGDPLRTVDTLYEIGGLWSYNRGVLEKISDPFAAMPSLHLGWATWVAFAICLSGSVVGARPSWRRIVLCSLYPLATAFAVIATGTHWHLDGVAGSALTALVVYLGVRLFGRPAAQSPPREDEPEASVAAPTSAAA
jgi:membrane-associated phospholipid phosphatase